MLTQGGRLIIPISPFAVSVDFALQADASTRNRHAGHGRLVGQLHLLVLPLPLWPQCSLQADTRRGQWYVCSFDLDAPRLPLSVLIPHAHDMFALDITAADGTRDLAGMSSLGVGAGAGAAAPPNPFAAATGGASAGPDYAKLHAQEKENVELISTLGNRWHGTGVEERVLALYAK